MKVLTNLVFTAIVAFLLVPSPTFSEEEKSVSERWKSVLIEQKNKVGQLGDMSLEQVTDALDVLDTAQRTADMELLHQERVLEQLTESFNEIKETYLAKKREFETPSNGFAGGVEFVVTDFDDNIKVDYDFQKPESGYQHLAFQIEVANKSKRVVRISPGNFVLKDKAGRVFKHTSGRKEPDLPYMDVEPGDRLSGWITYQVPWDIYKEQLRIKHDNGRESSRWIPAWE